MEVRAFADEEFSFPLAILYNVAFHLKRLQCNGVVGLTLP